MSIELCFVAMFRERPDDPGYPGARMRAVLLKSQGELLPDELRARHAALLCGLR